MLLKLQLTLKGYIMKYELKTEILGFENIKNIELHKIDELFATITTDNSDISFTVANPYLLREYSFDLPSNLKVLLDVKEESKLEVYCIVIIQDPLNESLVNFSAPIIFNHDNAIAVQAVLAENENRVLEKLKTLVIED